MAMSKVAQPASHTAEGCRSCEPCQRQEDRVTGATAPATLQEVEPVFPKETFPDQQISEPCQSQEGRVNNVESPAALQELEPVPPTATLSDQQGPDRPGRADHLQGSLDTEGCATHEQTPSGAGAPRDLQAELHTEECSGNCAEDTAPAPSAGSADDMADGRVAADRDSEDVVGTYQSRSYDGKTVMLLRLSEDGRWEHVARRVDTTQHYIFHAPQQRAPASSSVLSSALWWWPFSFNCSNNSCEDKGGSTKQVAVAWDGRPKDVTVKFWEMAQCAGEWRLDCSSSPSSLELLCDPLEEDTWTSGQEDPTVPLRKLYDATRQEHQTATELSEEGDLRLHYTVLPGEEAGTMFLELLHNGMSIPEHDRRNSAQSFGSTMEPKTRIAVQALGFNQLYERRMQ